MQNVRLGLFAALLAALPAFGSADFAFLPLTPQVGQPVSFFDRASVGPIPKNKWQWSFGDGGTSSEPNPTHVYTKAGTYSVTFAVSYANPASPETQRVIKSIVIAAADPLVARFGVSRFPVVKERVTFSDQSTGNPTSWLWTFGDGTSATTENSARVYEQPGEYVVTLRVSRGPARDETSTTSRTVAVAGATAPRVVVSSPPSGMLQAVGEGTATDSFALTNLGNATAALTLSADGTFFTVTPPTLTLEPRAKATVFVRALAQPAGAYAGAVVISGASGSALVPVRLLSATPASGSTIIQALRSRVAISAPNGENPSGSISFKNRGTAPLQGIVVSDVPWITPQGGLINIAPGETGGVRFTIDRAKRPDGGTTTSSLSGKISLLFLRGTAGKGVVEAQSTTPPASVSVTLVDMVKPVTAPGAPPSLAANEQAVFIPGFSSKDGALGDLHFASSASPTANLKLYFLTASAAQVASVSPPPQNSGISLAAVVTTVFGTESQTGGVQIRGAEIGQLNVGALHFINSSEGTYGSALPVFRSGAAVGAAAGQLLSGVLKSAGARTNVYLQEVGGFAADVTLGYFDAQGRVNAPATTHSVPAFGFLELADVVTTGTAMVRVVNTSTNGGKVVAFASVIDVTTNDSAAIIDPGVYTTSALTSVLLPVLPAGSGAAKTDLFVTNRNTATPISVTMRLRGGDGPRQRSTRSGAASGSPGGERTMTLAAGETLTMADLMKTLGTSSDGTGLVTITSAAPFSASARTYVAPASGGTIGSSLPLVPAGSGLTSGKSKRFAGVDSASLSTIAKATGGTFRTNLALVETTGQSTNVRLTLYYSFAAGLTAANSFATRDYPLTPRQLLLINDLAGAIIGEERESFGDLRDMQLLVEVIDGSGAVMPLLQSFDNQSGDSLTRVD